VNNVNVNCLKIP